MRQILLVLAMLMLAGGCETNVNFRTGDFTGEKLYRKGGGPGPQLSEADVLGLQTKAVSDAEIERILEETRLLKIKREAPILLVQSGADHPDEEMVKEISKHFKVMPHTGVPSEIQSEGGAISKALRLAAAQSKAETILVYWGHLEVKRDDLPTEVVSWVPVVDMLVPDEHQRMRMHLKMAVIDVRTGNWAVFRTEAIEEQALTTRYAREHDGKGPLRRMKSRLYASAVQKLLEGYVVASR